MPEKLINKGDSAIVFGDATVGLVLPTDAHERNDDSSLFASAIHWALITDNEHIDAIIDEFIEFLSSNKKEFH